jgi:hypothetical protein
MQGICHYKRVTLTLGAAQNFVTACNCTVCRLYVAPADTQQYLGWGFKLDRPFEEICVYDQVLGQALSAAQPTAGGPVALALHA